MRLYLSQYTDESGDLLSGAILDEMPITPHRAGINHRNACAQILEREAKRLGEKVGLWDGDSGKFCNPELNHA